MLQWRCCRPFARYSLGRQNLDSKQTLRYDSSEAADDAERRGRALLILWGGGRASLRAVRHSPVPGLRHRRPARRLPLRGMRRGAIGRRAMGHMSMESLARLLVLMGFVVAGVGALLWA